MGSIPSDWVKYDWNVRGVPAVYAVDTSFFDSPVEDFKTLLYCVLSPIEEQAGAFSAKELKRLEKLEKRIRKALSNALFVGYIFMDDLKQLYFYVQDKEASVSAIQKLADGEKRLHFAVDTADEPDWLTYHALLFPDAVKYQTIRNEKCIEDQRAVGDALDKVRRISLLVSFPTDQARQMFMEDARTAGFAIGEPTFEPELELAHVQTLYTLSSLDKRQIDDITTRVIRAAEPHNGELLRWICPRVARRSPLQ